MELKLSATVNGQYSAWEASVVIPELYRQTFEPLRTCDDPLIAYATGDILENTEEVIVVLQTRKDAADIIAKQLSKMIVDAMQKEDTHNGYQRNSKEG